MELIIVGLQVVAVALMCVVFRRMLIDEPTTRRLILVLANGIIQAFAAIAINLA